MYARLTKCAEEFTGNLTSTNGETFNVHPLLRRLTLDNISRSAFGVKSDVQKDPFGPKPKYQQAAEDSWDLLGKSWLNPVARKIAFIKQHSNIGYGFRYGSDDNVRFNFVKGLDSMKTA